MNWLRRIVAVIFPDCYGCSEPKPLVGAWAVGWRPLTMHDGAHLWVCPTCRRRGGA